MKYALSVRPTFFEVIEQVERTVCALRNAHFDNLESPPARCFWHVYRSLSCLPRCETLFRNRRKWRTKNYVQGTWPGLVTATKLQDGQPPKWGLERVVTQINGVLNTGPLREEFEIVTHPVQLYLHFLRNCWYKPVLISVKRGARWWYVCDLSFGFTVQIDQGECLHHHSIKIFITWHFAVH
jgi:hypothetical protein